MALKVNDISPQVEAMSTAWPAVDALLGGTDAMRRAGRSLLPQHPAEEDDAYRYRLSTATLFPAYRRTLSVMAGKPFAKEITYGDDVPQHIQSMCDDVDLQGKNLHSFAASVFYEALAYGICGILVDMPVRPNDLIPSRESESLAGFRPYMRHVKHGDILGWREELVDGVPQLSQLRIRDVVQEPDGEYGTKIAERVRVLRPGSWELWQVNDQGQHELIDAGINSLREIPFAPVYGRQTAFMQGVSPLNDMAYLNIKHWQSQSDQDNILRVARVPILAVSGLHDDDDFKLLIGSGVATRLPDGGGMQYIEHSGAAISAGQAALDALESQMIQTGAELLVKQPGQRSATESSNDAEANKSELQAIAESFEDALDMALQFMAGYMGGDEGGHVSLFKDYAAATLSDASAQLILSMQQSGIITKTTAIREQQRRGMLAPDIDPAKEQEAVDAEGPALGRVSDDGE